jgi:hypothetical protein
MLVAGALLIVAGGIFVASASAFFVGAGDQEVVRLTADGTPGYFAADRLWCASTTPAGMVNSNNTGVTVYPASEGDVIGQSPAAQNDWQTAQITYYMQYASNGQWITSRTESGSFYISPYAGITMQAGFFGADFTGLAKGNLYRVTAHITWTDYATGKYLGSAWYGYLQMSSLGLASVGTLIDGERVCNPR